MVPSYIGGPAGISILADDGKSLADQDASVGLRPLRGESVGNAAADRFRQ